MRRNFLPVGQGAFYLEQFDKKTFGKDVIIVYDCGSLTDVNLVEEEIRKHLREGEKIDAVFLSHLHADHINGLPYLLKYCDVKKIYFPLVTPVNMKILRMDQLIKSKDNFTAEFLEDPYTAIRKYARGGMPELIAVRAVETQGSIDDVIRNANRRVVQSGVNVGEEIWEKEARKIPWVFVPYNFEVDSRAKRIMQQLRSEKIGIETVDDIELVWQTANPYIKRKIKNIFGERQEANINSMTLFSGETAGVMRQTMCSEKDNMPSGCLYTGDYNAKTEDGWRTLKESYRKYWEHIGCVQIPHHGSRYSFNTGFLEFKHCYYIVFAGNKSKFCHPHAEVMKSFLIADKRLYLASETGEQTLWVE